jgi:hypothetical protein
MKKTITILSFIALTITSKSFAQPAITSLNFTNLGSKLFLYPINETFIHLDAGANLTWNYGNIDTLDAIMYFVDVHSSTQAQAVLDAFPSASYFTEINLINNTTIQTTVSEVNSSGQYTLGYVNGTSITVLPAPKPIIELPLAYQNVFGTSSYEAYGTLTTPFGTYDNVVRLADVGTTNTKYLYYSFSPVVTILMTYDKNNSTQEITGAYFLNLETNGLNLVEHKKQNFKIFPNPSNDIFTINWTGKEAALTISSVSGQIIHSSKLDKNLTFDFFEKGIYFITIKEGNNSLTEKIIIQ